MRITGRVKYLGCVAIFVIYHVFVVSKLSSDCVGGRRSFRFSAASFIFKGDTVKADLTQAITQTPVLELPSTQTRNSSTQRPTELAAQLAAQTASKPQETKNFGVSSFASNIMHAFSAAAYAPVRVDQTLSDIVVTPPNEEQDEASFEKRWFVICLTSAPRGNTSYLSEVLTSIHHNLQSSLINSSDYYVVTLDVAGAGNRTDIANASAHFPDFHFHPLRNRTDQHCTHNDTTEGRIGQVACFVRQQSYDVAAALHQCRQYATPHGWVMLVEDDTPMCANALPVMTDVLRQMDSDEHQLRRRAWRVADFSRTFSGTAFAAGKLDAFAAAVLANATTRPVDIVLWDEWDPSYDLVYTGNLFRHLGYVSSIPGRNTAGFHKRYDTRRFEVAKTRCEYQSKAQLATTLKSPPMRKTQRRPA